MITFFSKSISRNPFLIMKAPTLVFVFGAPLPLRTPGVKNHGFRFGVQGLCD